MFYNIEAGQTQEISYDFGQIVPLPGYPTVTVLDSNNVVGTYYAQYCAETLLWTATISVPNVGADTKLIWIARWTVTDGTLLQEKDIPLFVNPNATTVTGDLVILPQDPLAFNVPQVVPGQTISVFRNNDLVQNLVPTVTLLYDGSASLSCSHSLSASMAPYLVMYAQNMFNLWVASPRMYAASIQVENFINKARTQQVIPQLAYSQADLFYYLERGLNLFNMFPPQVFNYTGVNMQGPLFEAHTICAQYYALAAQLQAEGSLQFDFSGQAITLNVDRTSSIESALGRVESLLNDKIPVLKRMLAKYGNNGGDGSSISRDPTAWGRLGISSGAMTVGNAFNVAGSGYGPGQRTILTN